jgi:hypothetical protein
LNFRSVLICEFFGARIVLNPQRVASPIDYETNFARLVLILRCELRQLALRTLGHQRILFRNSLSVDSVLQTIRAVVHILLRPPFQSGTFFLRQFADNFRWRAQYERAGRNFRSLCYQRLRADERLLADDCAIEDHCAHADQRFVADGAGMDNRAMADRDPVADEARKIVREVQHGVVLDVRVMADNDAVDVAAQHRAMPHARMSAKRHIADDRGVFGDENIFAQRRFFAEEFVELRGQFVHAENLTGSDGGTI